jgi:mannose-1-phosphate guanylyltransferase
MVLKAVILVGGYGTRLRPLTFSKPKPLVEFCNKSIVKHQIDALVSVGVGHIILCVSYRAEALESELKAYGDQLNIVIETSLEDTPMGTGGPLSLCRDKLDMGDSDPFFMLNADVTSTYPFQQLLDFHRAHGREGTIMVTQVDDPSKYGVVVAKDNGEIERFVEKPKVFVGDKINAGMYVFNKSILNRIPNAPTSIERETFPAMAAEKELYRFVLPGFWMDIGQPKDYLTGQVLKLKSLSETNPEVLASGDNIKGNVLISEYDVKVGNNCVLGPDVVIGPGVTIGDGVRLKRCAIFAGCRLDDYCYVDDSIVGWNSSVGTWSRVQEHCFFGEDVHIKPERFVRSLIVCPHKGVKADNLQDDKIILGIA